VASYRVEGSGRWPGTPSSPRSWRRATARSCGPGCAPAGIVPGLLPATPAGPTSAQLSHFRWSSLPPSPLGHRSDPLLSWTGRYLIELGGYQRGQYVPQDGAAYDAAANRWHRIAPVPRELDLAQDITAWTGRQLFVANGQTLPYWGYAKRGTAALYDPVANRWTVIGLPREMLGATQLTAAWTGRDIVLASAGRTPGNLHVAAYNPAAGRWTDITPALPPGHPSIDVAMVATTNRLLLWSSWTKPATDSNGGHSVASGIDLLSVGRRHGWSTVARRWLQHRAVYGPVYAGGQIFLLPSQIYCGLCSHPFFEYPARLVDPTTLAISQVPAGPLAGHPGGQADLWLWTGRAVIAGDQREASWVPATAESRLWIPKLAAYDPAADRWLMLTAPPRDTIAAAPVWAGRQLFLLTGAGTLLTFRR
jgi:hypothetical protein